MTDRDQMDRRLADGLDRVMTAQIERDTAGPERARPSRAAARGGRTVWVTAAVGLVVALLTVLTLQAVGAGRQADPAATHGVHATPASLLKQLPAPRSGRIVHTWTERSAATTGPFAVAGSTVVLAGVCTGGGAVFITDVTGKAHTLNCAKVGVQQPFWRSAPGTDALPRTESSPARVGVTVVRGAPRFVVRMWAVDPRALRSGWVIAPTSAAVPASLRTCTAGDLAPEGTFAHLDAQQGGLVTITNRSSTDCAVRSWPALQYLDAAGMRIGPTQGGSSLNGRSLDSREGSVNAFDEFPPARLKAGAHGYLIVDLFTKARLESDDASTRKTIASAAATAAPGAETPASSLPICHPVAVAALRLTVSGSTITVPVPADPVTAACPGDGFAFGVDPVVARDPGTR